MQLLRRFWFAAVFLIVLLLPALALAAPVTGPAPDEPIDVWLKRAVISTLWGGALVLGKKIWNFFQSHEATRVVVKEAAKVARELDLHKLIQEHAQQAIDYADELAHQAKKRVEVFTSKMKEDAAVARGLDLLQRAGLDMKKLGDAAEDELRKVILARLGRSRAPRATPRPLQTPAPAA